MLEANATTKESIIIVKYNLKQTSMGMKKVNESSIAATNPRRRTRRKVTTCLYRSPKNRARSLSTLMAVDIKIVTLINKALTKTKKSKNHGRRRIKTRHKERSPYQANTKITDSQALK